MSDLKLITDRTEIDRVRLEALNAKGWDAMTADEKFYWRCGEAEILELLDGTLETSDGLLVGAGNAVTRGAYNYQDLNRVEEAVQIVSSTAFHLVDEIASYLVEKGVATDAMFELPYKKSDSHVPPAKLWESKEIPSADDLSAYLAKVQIIRDILPTSAPLVPADMDGLRVEEANNIEKILEAVYAELDVQRVTIKDRADRTAESWNYSGEFFAGEVKG